jgi:DNA-binding MarR family transcriptional regulator
VRVTDAGRAVLAERTATRTQVLRERLADLDADDQRLLLAALPAIERLIATTEAKTNSRKSRS